MTNEIRHTADLPHGYRATFIFDRSEEYGSVDWEPQPPPYYLFEDAQFREAFAAAKLEWRTEVSAHGYFDVPLMIEYHPLRTKPIPRRRKRGRVKR